MARRRHIRRRRHVKDASLSTSPGGRTLGASSGQKDDRVIAAAIAIEMAKQTFVRKGLRPHRPDELTFSDVDKMAEELHEQRNRIPLLGENHMPVDW